MKQLTFGQKAKLRYSVPGLWWRYINYGGQELGGIFIAGLGLFMIFVSICGLAIVVAGEGPFWLDGQQVQATITRKWIAETSRPVADPSRLAKGRRGPQRRVEYTFRDRAGNMHQGQGTFAGGDWDNARVGGLLTVEYLAADPDRNRPAGRVSGLFLLIPGMVLLVGGTIAYGGIRWLILGIRNLARQVRLVRTGQATAGLIDRLQPMGKPSERTSAVECSYRYFIPGLAGGRVSIQEGTASLYPRQVKELHVNDAVLILFDPQRPENHTIDIHHARLENPAKLLPSKQR